ncbi:type VI secretion system accessory protein TagJ [Burkholderia vietnamiensis]|uniref:type VI secretion system accessory protein TagJ n=1 Tax=Burkholderia vietnamiensis TaxID=60552 RepID=UPI0007524F49|nr:type VI secretion system accessory protein TagJ [Burkholderia vietnamiensis]KVE72322.1 ImpE/SciE family protein [Burkholderia vietnamiensis]
MTRLTASDTPYTHRLGEAPLSEQIERISARLRAQPTTASHRWALFQLMCVTGEWTRAIQQLQTWAKLEPGQAPTAQVYRDLIRAERWRRQVVDGCERPGFVLEPPAWLDGLLTALRFAADGQIEQADGAREAALDAAASVAVRGPQGNAAWIVDSDSSFGPVCEVITAGHYRWVPFTDLVAWRVSPPTKLVDLVWAPCTLTLVDGAIVHGFMPARYPGSEAGDDAMRLGRSTVWQESGRTGVTALGRKTWATDRGDFSLFELAGAEFGTPIADDTGIGERAGD